MMEIGRQRKTAALKKDPDDSTAFLRAFDCNSRVHLFSFDISLHVPMVLY